MRLEVTEYKVKVSGQGIEFLRLKAEISKRIKEAESVGRNVIVVPRASFYLISDLFDKEELGDTVLFTELNNYRLHEEARTKIQNILANGSDLSMLPNRWHDVLDSAQAQAVMAMTLPGLLGICLFDEQGIGKTVMTLAAYDFLKETGSIDGMIVVCPKSMINGWETDTSTFLGNKYDIVVADGNKHTRYESAYKDFDILVTNFEGLEVMTTLLEGKSKNVRYLFVVDESFYVKNQYTNRSAKIAGFRKCCKRCYVLCGTPAPNNAYDIINQFNISDMGFTFAGFQKTDSKTEDKARIMQLIESKGAYIRRLKVDVLENLPAKAFHIVSIELKGRQKLLYDRAKHDLELHLRSLDNRSFKKQLGLYFQRRTALLQICINPSIIDPTYSEEPAKYVELDKLVELLTMKGRKIIIWSFYKRSIEDLVSRYSIYNPVSIDGATSIEDRKAAVRLFQEAPQVMMFIGNPAAAGAGITLHSSYDSIYLSYSNQAAHYLQSLDRTHRRGQKATTVNYYLLVCKATIEETEVFRLREKELNQHQLLSDNIEWPSSLDDALKELINE